MINANTARELVEQSQVVMSARMEKLSIKIEEAANLGKRELSLSSAFMHDREYEVNFISSFYAPDFTPLQRLIKAELEKEGFGVKIVSYEYDANKSFKSMSDSNEPDMKKSYYINVTW